jgi:hypothetical protein
MLSSCFVLGPSFIKSIVMFSNQSVRPQAQKLQDNPQERALLEDDESATEVL